MTAPDPADVPQPARGRSRGRLLRDLLVFQGKLFVDGFRDLLLSPASLLLGLADLVAPSAPGPRFYRLLELGRRSDHWINLFGAADPPASNADGDAGDATRNIDGLVDRFETTVRDQLRSGTLPAGARRALATRLASLRDRVGDGEPEDRG